MPILRPSRFASLHTDHARNRRGSTPDLGDLDPEFDAVMRDHIARVIEYAPAYSDNFRTHAATFLRLQDVYGQALFSNPSANNGGRSGGTG